MISQLAKLSVLLCVFTLLMPVAVGQDGNQQHEDSLTHPDFVHIPAGRFRLGFHTDDGGEHRFRLAHPYSNAQNFKLETPVHNVSITRPFEISRTEVTVGQFKTFVDETGFVTDAEKGGGASVWNSDSDSYVDRFEKRSDANWKNPGFPQTDQHPVVGISHNDAVAYCAWLSKVAGRTIRLPSEAEWEYACRAGSDSWYSWGEDPDAAYQHANVADGALEAKYPRTTSFQRAVRLDADEGDGEVFTAPVGTFQPNPWGLHDMHGNVWEWCQDRWDAQRYRLAIKGVSRKDLPTHVVKDPVFLTKTEQHKYGDWRVMRGGAWTCAPASVRCSIRTFAEASDANVYTGFRVVREDDGKDQS